MGSLHDFVGTRSDHNVRVDELAALSAALDKLADGRSRAVEIFGDPGMGRTRLLSELSAEAAQRELPVLFGRCRERSPEVPVLAGIMEQARTAGRAPVPPGTAPARAELERVARRGALLILDDTHWIDPDCLDLVDSLVQSPIQAPLLLVVAHRTRQAPTGLRSVLAYGAQLGRVRGVELGGLTLEQSASLLGVPADDPWLRRIHAESDGVPRYLLARAAQLPQPHGAPPEPSHDQTVLSDEVASAGLLEDEVAAAHAAAVLGDTLDVDLVAAVSELPQERCCAAISALLRRDILRRAAQPSNIAFRHRCLRDAAYDLIDPCRRSHSHRRALTELTRRSAPAAALAPHIEGSLGQLEPADNAVLVRAAEEVGPADPGTAVRWLELAMHATTNADDRSRMAARRAGLLAAAGRAPESLEALEELRLSGAGGPELRGQSAALAALIECLLGKYSRAHAVLNEAEASLTGDHPRALVGLIVRRALIGLIDGRVPTPEVLARLGELAERDGSDQARACVAAVDAFTASSQGRLRDGVRAVDRCAALVDRMPNAELAGVVDIFALIGWAAIAVRRFDDAERQLTRGLSMARECGDVLVQPLLQIGLGIAHHDGLGHNTEARRSVAQAADLGRRIGSSTVRDIALALEAHCISWVEQEGDADRALRLAARAMTAPMGGYWHGFATMLFLRAALDRAAQLKERVDLVVETVGGADLPRLHPIARAWCFARLADYASGADDPSACRWAELAVHAADELDLPYQQAYGHLARGHVQRAQGDADAAARLYQEAARLFSVQDMVSSQVQAMLLAVPCLVACGRPDEADTVARLARQLADRTGVRRLRTQVTRELVVGQLPAQEGTRLSTLTRREWQVAAIASTGKKTREIAEELSVSPRTVDVHLTRIYRKLNISSRATLARLMTEIQAATRGLAAHQLVKD